VELALFAAVLGGVVSILCRELLPSSSLRRQIALFAGTFCAAGLVAAAGRTAAEEADAKKAPAGRPEGQPAVKKLVKPENWPQDHPLPLVGSNCASCHLTAGRELTAAVVNFVRSAHDFQEMTCYDCHGGNSVDDVKAHYEDFGFIGTKKSAHIATCSECHAEEAELLAAGPHHWDFSKRINTEFPMCFDCHGNHDIGNVPEDFSLVAWCSECHDEPEKEFPNLLAVATENDRLWKTMGQVRRKRVNEAQPLPAEFQDDVASLRRATMELVHTSKEITPDQARAVNKQAESLRNAMQKWLESNP
jgi:hypothetical protein